MKKGERWRRKRDKTLVIIDRVGRTSMDYVVQWNLTIYTTTAASFLRNYRLETSEEAASNRGV